MKAHEMKEHYSFPALDSATGRKVRYTYFSFSSRFQRAKWIRQHKKNHPGDVVSKYYIPEGNKLFPGVEVISPLG